VTLTDAANNTTPPLTTIFTIDTTAPLVPSITLPINNSITNDNTPTLTGIGEPSSIFIVRNTLGAIIATGTVDLSGNYSFSPSSPLPE
jgi:large repetitive protein